jgi:2'-5' RNA ligase
MTDSLLELDKKATDPARYSVQSRADDSQAAPGSDVNGVGMFWLGLGQRLDEEIPWNAIYPNMRDRFLIEFARKEPMMAAARYSMKTRVSTLNYKMNGPPRTKKFAQELLNNPGLGDNLSQVVQKLSDDLDTSDNGAFLELWRPGSPTSDAGSRPVVGFAHLDSRQCWRSFDPDFPVWYTNPITGAVRKIHRSRVVMASDNPQPIELARGIGFCAVSRALRWTRIIRNILTFTDEKVSGQFTRAIGAISGITGKQAKAVLRDNLEEADRKGYVVFKDIPFFTSPGDDGNEIKIMLQDLASIPDGFDFKTDIELYAYVLAFCFGVDAREFWPVSQGLGSKGEATVQNMKARGRGIGNRIQTVEYMLRQCLPATVEFESDFVDDEQDEMQTRIQAEHQKIYSLALKDGGINNLEYRALLIADGIIDGKLLEALDIPVTSDDTANNEEGESDSLEANTSDSADPTDTAVASLALKAGHSGVMAALYLPKSAADELYEQVAPGLVKAGIVPIPPSEYHITLVYAGDTSFYDAGEKVELLTGVAETAIQSLPFKASLSGIGRFMTDQGDNTHPLYVSVDSAYLPDLRQRLFDRLKFHLAIEQNHGFTPHITIGYIPAEQDTPQLLLQPMSMDFNALILAWGDQLTRYSLGITEDTISLKSLSDYRRSLRSLVRGYWKGDLGAFDFVDGMTSSITRHFTQAWEEGARKFGVTSGEMTDAEKIRLQLEINTEISYTVPFADAIADESKANGGALGPLFDRVELWVNNYGRIVSLAGSMAAADKKAQWAYGDTIKHCDDCSTYAGRVYRNSVWLKFLEPYDAMPRGHGLACSGFNCDCDLKPTSEPVTPGRPPIPKGPPGKKSHEHPIVESVAVPAYA